jgi:RND family efflux transporter MFP subunit
MTNSPNNGYAGVMVKQRTSTAVTSPAHEEETRAADSAWQTEVIAARPWKTRWVASMGIFLAIVLIGAFAAATSPRIHRERQLAAAADKEQSAQPRRDVVTVQPGTAASQRELPGNAQANFTASIYGRTNGYLKRWLVDIGDKVQAGQLMAEIETPELDAQLKEAKATLLQNKANLQKLQADEVYARDDEARYRPLMQKGAVTQEQWELKYTTWKVDVSNVAAMEATIEVNEANIERLSALQSFEKVTAPFTGVVTARTVDPGDLITSDNPSTEHQLFHVDQIDPLRVFVDVPQVYSTDVKPGQKAMVYRREEPSRQYTGTVTRTANSLDPNTRTLKTQVDVPNPKGELLPGMYLEVKFIFDRQTAPVIIPTAAIIVRTGAPRVATVDEHDQVRYCEVKLGRDFGEQVEVLSGLQSGQRVIVYPGDDLPEGTTIEPAVAAVK